MIFHRRPGCTEKKCNDFLFIFAGVARIEINFPDKEIFSTELSVRITDLNYGAHLGNDSLLSLLHEARMQFFTHFGYTEKNIEGAGIIMADAGIIYKAEAWYGDRLRIAVAADDFTRVAFDLYYKVTCGDRPVAVAKTGIVFYDYEKKKVTAVPDVFRMKMENAVQ